MSSRAASPFDANEQPPTKRAKIQQEETIACLSSLNDDCLLHILAHTATEDLNSFAICNKRCQKVRAHNSLDQARRGTITISQGCTFESLCEAINQGNWDEDFQGNQTHDAIVDGLERLDGNARFGGTSLGSFRFQLSGVTKLHFKSSPVAHCQYLHFKFPWLFPNLREVDLSSMNVVNKWGLCHSFCLACQTLYKLTWNGHNSLSPNGSEFHSSPHLSELHLKESVFRIDLEKYEGFVSNSFNDGKYLFSHCRHLERLSIKNATWNSYNNGTQPVSQEMLIKMVRCHRTLRWLRSDLSEENVCMLQQERPEITFVSD